MIWVFSSKPLPVPTTCTFAHWDKAQNQLVLGQADCM